MTKTLIFAVLILIASISGFSQKQHCTIKLNIQGLDSRLLRFTYWELPDGEFKAKHKFSKNDKLTIEIPVEKLTFCRIFTFKNSDHFRTKRIELYLTPNDTIIVEGKLIDSTIDYKAKGNEYCVQYSEFRNYLLPYLEEESELYRQMRREKKGSEKRQIAEKKFNDYRFNDIHFWRTEFAKKHLDFFLSPRFLMTSKVPRDTTIKYYDLLTDHVKASSQGVRMKRLIDGWNAVEINSTAPDFSAKTLNGEVFTLSQMTDKIIVLDFWGSWCGSCIKGFPKMKEYYTKYSENLEIIGIACNDSKDKWIKAICKYELDWINVLNQDQQIDELYGVTLLPTKVIIDKSGNIITSFEGENENFYKELDKLLNK